MANHTAEIIWTRDGQDFAGGKYSRKHLWKFDGGAEVAGSPAPQVVPPPLSAEEAVDPEEAFVASLSSCHMLWFLAIAGKKGFIVDEYCDNAAGATGKNAEGKIMVTEVVLRPAVAFSGERVPTAEEIHAMHHEAHEKCFIANSVKSDVRCEPRV